MEADYCSANVSHRLAVSYDAVSHAVTIPQTANDSAHWLLTVKPVSPCCVLASGLGGGAFKFFDYDKLALISVFSNIPADLDYGFIRQNRNAVAFSDSLRECADYVCRF